MRDFPSCFGENGVQVADASCSSAVVTKKACPNSITCVYKCKLLGKSCLITLSWSKNLIGQCLSVEIDDSSHHCICKIDVKPSLFSKRKGSKFSQVDSTEIEVFWDLSSAKFGSGSEPLEGYYIAIVSSGEMLLLVGDLKKEALKKTGAIASPSNAVLISKREHISAKRVYQTKARFFENGPTHDLKIEYDPHSSSDPGLVVRIDTKTVMQIKHLQWNFRGNYSILIDGLAVEVYWDVHNWLFGPGLGNAVFMFQTSLSVCDSPVLSWRCSESLREANAQGLGFSFFLYAWRNE
ncbi:hypothetical protein ABFS83_07G030800 [Erythranthe nasuta]